MKPSNKLLGTAGLLGAPGLFLQLSVCQRDGVMNSSLGGFFDLLYMLGWMCSIVGILRIQATGNKRSGIALLYVQLALLCVANVWNVWVIIDPSANSTMFLILDMFWPLSNVCMLATGIVVAVTGRLKGWQRYAVLFAGLWLPFAMGLYWLAGSSTVSFYITSIYSVVAWSLVALVVFTSGEKNDAKPQLAI
ncbi:MAG TPA: hypothetical protein VM871_06240 [Flavisolibacter sp.]|jgi:hypothetical protein|nr:hypothetical protein [Flavisolibacter sp.]